MPDCCHGADVPQGALAQREVGEYEITKNASRQQSGKLQFRGLAENTRVGTTLAVVRR